MPSWTSDQLDAINREGKNIIVSAGAGSGKTAVLTERVIRKLKDGVSVDRLLVLTFTNEAAGEMKTRIRKAIKKIDDLKDQLNYIDSAYITTFDSFALSVVKKYHYLLNVSKNISIIDSSIVDIKKREFIDEIFNDLYEKEDKNFLKLIGDFCNKDDNDIKNAILKINSKLDLKYDKKEFLNNYIDLYYSDSYVSKIVSDFDNLIKSKVSLIKDLYEVILSCEESKKIVSYEEGLSSFINSSNYDEIKKNLPYVSLPRIVKYSKEEKAKIKDLLDEISSLVMYDSLEDAKNIYLGTKEYVMAFIDVINKLDEKVSLYKKNKGSYEFVDISMMAIDIVNKNEDVRNEIKNFYNEIMVDEYQDTSDLQEIFINLIENDNVYMVGDIKQSIYRFRNANPFIFKNKYDLYSKGDSGYKIDLVKNFRSREEVLSDINVMFNKIMDDFLGGADYSSSHQMVFGNLEYNKHKMNHYNNYLELLNYDPKSNNDFSKDEKEAFIIANDIKSKIENNFLVFDKESGNYRKACYKDFCIIMDRGSAFHLYKKIFEYMNIPLVLYTDEKLTTEYDMFIIKNLVNLICKIKNRLFDQEFRYYFTSVARSYLFEYTDDEIFRVFKDNSFKDTSIYELGYDIAVLMDDISCYKFLELVLDKFRFYDNFIKYRDIDKSMIRISYLETLSQNLETLGYTPYEFASYLEEMIDSDSEIKYKVNTSDDSSVRIMNIHKSKGLEFPVCYFSGLYKEFNMRDVQERFLFDDDYGIITPYNRKGIGSLFTKSFIRDKYIKEEISEKIRLLYVAVTRAREKMIFVGPLDDEEYNFSSVVDSNIRLCYRSFMDIINTIKGSFESNVINVDFDKIILSKDYNKYKKKDLSFLSSSDKKLVKSTLEKDCLLVKEERFSKKTVSLHSLEELKNMEFGTYIHYVFETADFNCSDNKYVNNFLKQDVVSRIGDATVFKEYEFVYEKDDKKFHGIIDLMLLYDDHVDIIDYKLSDTSDSNYKKQLYGYKEYISSKTNLDVYTYLYSILEDRVVKI